MEVIRELGKGKTALWITPERFCNRKNAFSKLCGVRMISCSVVGNRRAVFQPAPTMLLIGAIR
jgi:hypothetical protein